MKYKLKNKKTVIREIIHEKSIALLITTSLLLAIYVLDKWFIVIPYMIILFCSFFYAICFGEELQIDEENIKRYMILFLISFILIGVIVEFYAYASNIIVFVVRVYTTLLVMTNYFFAIASGYRKVKEAREKYEKGYRMKFNDSINKKIKKHLRRE